MLLGEGLRLRLLLRLLLRQRHVGLGRSPSRGRLLGLFLTRGVRLRLERGSLVSGSLLGVLLRRECGGCGLRPRLCGGLRWVWV